MKKSSSSNLETGEVATHHRPTREAVDLEFPADAEFVSRPPQLSSTDYVKWCAEMMAALPTDLEKKADKARHLSLEEFNL